MRTRTYFMAVVLGILTIAASGCGPGSSSPLAPTAGATVGGKQAGAYTISLAGAPNPAVRGDNTLEATVTDASGQPIADAKVSFDIDMTNMSHGKNVVVATSAGNGHYTGKVFYMMPGPWRVIVTVERAGQATASTRFDFSVNLR